MQLNDEQQRAFDLATKDQKANIFISGAGGCGKSFLIKYFANYFASNDILFAICAPTGIASASISGQTIHRFFGLRPNIITIDDYKRLNRFKKRKADKDDGNSSIVMPTLKNVKVIIIDEISMVSGSLLTLISEIAKYERHDDSAPFGGLKVLIFGDFFQIPPVESGPLAFESPVWKELELKHVLLHKIIRQADTFFSSQLSKLRLGNLDEQVFKMFREVCATPKTRNALAAENKTSICTIDENTIRLESLNRDKNEVNDKKHALLDAEEYIYTTQYWKPLTKKDVAKAESLKAFADETKEKDDIEKTANAFEKLLLGNKNVEEKNDNVDVDIDPQSLLKGVLAPDELRLKKGSPVLHLANNEPLYNGSTGIVIDPAPSDVSENPEMYRDSSTTFNATSVINGPLVEFKNTKTGEPFRMRIACHRWEILDSKGNAIAAKMQIPLVLAYSLSIHKAQGLSLDNCVVNLAKCFSKGQAYVSLSRARTLSGLQIVGLEGKSKEQIAKLFAADERVKNFYNTLAIIAE